jgi:hypothetical protein
MSGIQASKLNATARELADDIGPFARTIAQRLGLTFESLSPEEAKAVREAAKDPEILTNARKAFGGKAPEPTAAADTVGVSPEAAKARLSAPPPVEAGALVPAGPRGLVPPTTAAKARPALDHAPSTDVNPVAARYEEPAQSTALARTTQPEVMDAEIVGGTPPPPGVGKKVAAGAALLGGAGATSYWASKDDEPAEPSPKPVEDSAQGADPLAGAKMPEPPAAPGGQIKADDFVRNLPSWKPAAYAGPGAPELTDAVTIDGKQVRPVDLMAKAQQDLVAATNKLAAEYRAERDTLKQRELFEGIVQAVGHLAAGWYGMRHGVDMSGVKFNVTDWVSQQEALRRHYDALGGMEKDKFGAAEKTAAAGERQIEQDWRRNSQLYEAAVRKWNADNENSFRSWQGQVKDVELKNQVTHWNKQAELEEQRIQAALLKGETEASRKDLLDKLRQLAEDKKSGQKVVNLIGRAAKEKNADAGAQLLAQAHELNLDLAGRGRAVANESVFTGPREGNTFFWEDSIPGPREPRDAAKEYAKQVAAKAAGAVAKDPAAAPPAARKKVRHKGSGAERLLTPDEIKQLPNPQDFEVVGG